MNTNVNDFAVDLKIIVVGNPYTGKTSFVKKWISGNFNNVYKATIISEFGSKTLNINGTIYRVQLWDIAGQDRSPYIAKIFSKDCHGALILCEANDDDSRNDIKQWYDLIKKHIKFADGGDLPYLLIQNKIDLVTDLESNRIKMEEFCCNNNIAKHFSTSAKTGYGINEAMDQLLEIIIQRWKNCSSNGPKDNSSINLKTGQIDGEQEKKCCFSK